LTRPPQALQFSIHLRYIEVDFEDLELSRAVESAMSSQISPRDVEAFWYPVYRVLFKPLKSGAYTAYFAEQYIVSRLTRMDTGESAYYAEYTERHPRYLNVLAARPSTKAGSLF